MKRYYILLIVAAALVLSCAHESKSSTKSFTPEVTVKVEKRKVKDAK